MVVPLVNPPIAAHRSWEGMETLLSVRSLAAPCADDPFGGPAGRFQRASRVDPAARRSCES